MSVASAMNAVEEHGWYVFPLCPLTKRPLLPWRELSNNSVGAVNQWAQRYPDCNWGVDCGKSGLVVLDVDNRNGVSGKQSVMEMELDAMRVVDTFTVCTPNSGIHYYYRGRCASRHGIRPGVDVKAAGGYVVLPGSTLPTGEYWIADPRAPAPCPDWLLTFVRATALERHALKDTWLIDPDKPAYVAWAINWLLTTAPDCVQGQHGDDLIVKKVFYTLRDNGLSAAKAVELVLAHYNDTKAFPPWTPEELALKARNAYAYAALPPGNATSAVATALAIDTFSVAPSLTAPKLCNAASIVIGDVPRRQWVLGRRLLRRYLTGTVAPGGVGKSTFAFLEALAVATGKPFTGDTVHATGPVILFNAEDALEELQMRIAAVAQLYDVKLSDLNGRTYQPIYLLSGRDYKLRIARATNEGYVANALDVQNLEALIREVSPVLFCGDPFVRLHDVPENDNIAIDKVVEIFTDLADRLNISISLVHHTRKRSSEGGAGEAETARGASAFTNGLRIAHTLTTMDEAEAKLYGVPKDLRHWYVRLDDAKLNFAQPSSTVRWFKRVSVDLPNGEAVGTLQVVVMEGIRKTLVADCDEAVRDVATLAAFCEADADTPFTDAVKAMCSELPDEKRTATALSLSLKRQLAAGPIRVENREIRLVDRGSGSPRLFVRVKRVDATLPAELL